MTAVDFPFFVAKQDDDSYTFSDARFRFSVLSARQMERSAGVGIGVLQSRGQNVEALVLMACYALRWKDKTITEDKAADLIDRFIEAGGDTAKLASALVKALNESGVYGKPDVPANDTGGAEANPTTETTSATSSAP